MGVVKPICLSSRTAAHKDQRSQKTRDWSRTDLQTNVIAHIQPRRCVSRHGKGEDERTCPRSLLRHDTGSVAKSIIPKHICTNTKGLFSIPQRARYRPMPKIALLDPNIGSLVHQSVPAGVGAPDKSRSSEDCCS
jgi:hypothetical protein